MPTLDWIGKKAVLNHHRQVPYRLLQCDRALSVGDPNAGNLLIQGDNLDALKALLPYYAGQVKCVYIDPPYNTGNEGWIYNDNVNSSEIRRWLGKVVGGETEDLTRHDKWLCMMYPRIALLREFLRADGLIFVSVDENEYRHLALLMDEVFGESNRLETIIWKKSYGGGAKSKHVVNLHEYIEVFARRRERVPTLQLPPSQSVLRYYKFRDDRFESRGPYRLQPLATTSMDLRPNLRYPILYQGEEIWPEKQWQWARERTTLALANDELVIAKRKGKWTVSYKQYLKDEDGEERSSKPYSIVEGIYTQQGTSEVRAIFGDGKAFSFPKPMALIKHLLSFATDKDSIVLDSFAGSGTTAHAVLELNSSDGGNRRFILVEMDGRISRDVTHERIKRVTKGIDLKGAADRGFKYCVLGEPLFDESGHIAQSVRFADLASHVYFTETGVPIPKRATGKSPLLGVHDGKAVYLLFNGVLGDKRPDGGNVLTGETLRDFPRNPDGDSLRVVYGEGCRLSAQRLKREGIVFKQVPYQIKVN